MVKVCIVGAGPAGAAASLVLSANGIPHLVMDSARFPRHKPCGDIITTGVLRAMNAVDPGILEELKAGNYLNPIWHTHTYPPNGKPLAIDFLPFDGQPGEPGCFSISRYEMDMVLVNRMKSTGFADFREDCRVTSLDFEEDRVLINIDNGEIQAAEMVIVATGSNNNLLKHLEMSQPKSDSAIGIRAHFQGVVCNSSCTELFLLPDLMPGGLYITPLSNTVCNVNLVVSLEKVNTESLNLREIFDKTIQNNALLRERFAHARRLNNFEGSMLFLGLHQRNVVQNRLLVAGDSAGLIEFFSGNGIPQALQSGKLAGLQAVKSVITGDYSAAFLSEYEIQLHKKIQKSYATGRSLYSLLHKKWFSRWVLTFLNHLSARSTTNILLRDLLYDRNPSQKMRSIRFWYHLLLR